MKNTHSAKNNFARYNVLYFDSVSRPIKTHNRGCFYDKNYKSSHRKRNLR